MVVIRKHIPDELEDEEDEAVVHILVRLVGSVEKTLFWLAGFDRGVGGVVYWRIWRKKTTKDSCATICPLTRSQCLQFRVGVEL